MSLKKRIVGTIIFLLTSLGILEISYRFLVPSIRDYVIFGRITPTYTKDQHIIEKDEIKKFFIRKDKILGMYQMMKDIDELFEKHNIKYFVSDGTLLGSVRNNGQIPYDDDLDISTLPGEGEKIKSIENELNQLGYILKIKYPDWYVIENKDLMCLDIFHMRKVGNKFDYANQHARKAWPEFFFYEKELYPLNQSYQFGQIKVFGPKNAANYLSRSYGDNWKEYAIFSGNHRTKYIGRTLKVLVAEIPELQIPAPSTGPLLDRVKK